VLFKTGRVLLQILDAVGMVPDLAVLEKAIELIASLESQELAGLIGRERAGSIALNGEGFQGFPCRDAERGRREESR